MIKKTIIALALLSLCGCGSLSDIVDVITPPPAPNTSTNAPAVEPDPPAPAQESCECDLSRPLCEPDKGEECPVPWGKDVRFLGWSPSKQDWQFIGFNEASATLDGNQITGKCFVKDGKKYHFVGHRQKSSSSEMLKDWTVECKPCHRVYYEVRAQ